MMGHKICFNGENMANYPEIMPVTSSYADHCIHVFIFLQALENLCDPIMNKPKPKPKEEPPKDEKKADEKTEEKTNNAAGDGKKEESTEQTSQAEGGDMDLD